MARPRRQNVVVIPIKLWLIQGRDDDILRFLATIPPGQRAVAVLGAMRGGIASQLQQSPSEEEQTNNILDALSGLWN